ncbi:hypothetical protein AAF712_010302 [Marasmius tenuissimus]|uniref:Uncharacterized protein n=1 Tax=Marasmius tenuissimus TaxID=585030 RepID=A0ABR2ZMP3_9AGAR
MSDVPSAFFKGNFHVILLSRPDWDTESEGEIRFKVEDASEQFVLSDVQDSCEIEESEYGPVDIDPDFEVWLLVKLEAREVHQRRSVGFFIALSSSEKGNAVEARRETRVIRRYRRTIVVDTTTTTKNNVVPRVEGVAGFTSVPPDGLTIACKIRGLPKTMDALTRAIVNED